MRAGDFGIVSSNRTRDSPNPGASTERGSSSAPLSLKILSAIWPYARCATENITGDTGMALLHADCYYLKEVYAGERLRALLYRR